MRPMPAATPVTRFAPSPTGDLHLGNLRTALFNALLARRGGGRFVLRVEDTDRERSSEEFTRRQMADLRWLGLDWDEGPDVGGPHAPYRQSERGELYAARFVQLERSGQVYPCFCTNLELEVSRRAQLAAGRPPRYAGTCRALSQPQRDERRARGLLPTLRFRVDPGAALVFDDLVHGPQSFERADIGDFVVRRADGSAAFFFSNAVDDAAMGITHVLRGEDHLANTPRQLLLLEALGERAPRYGHLALLVDANGAPLSKRSGAPSVTSLRERGFLPAAILNLLFRLGHSTAEHALLDVPAMVRAFDPGRLGRASARCDDAQLTTWQREAARALDTEAALDWLRPALPPALDPAIARSFVTAVRANCLLPADAARWAAVVWGAPPRPDAAGEAVVARAGPAFFDAAARAALRHDRDWRGLVAELRDATGLRGPDLYKPLRVALTGSERGPELEPLLQLMPPGGMAARLQRFSGTEHP
jgi:glutamyl-tRNA synthetase